MQWSPASQKTPAPDAVWYNECMKVLALDISTRAGWALLEGDFGSDSLPKILETGVIELGDPVSGFKGSSYPWDYVDGCMTQAEALCNRVYMSRADKVVVEETNRPGRFTSRYSQKILEFIHAYFLYRLGGASGWRAADGSVQYINTSDWRKAVGAQLTKADKALNAKIARLKRSGDKKALKALGVRGKISKKHVALRFVNQSYGLNLKMKDNDIADAICQGVAYLKGAPVCDGKVN